MLVHFSNWWNDHNKRNNSSYIYYVPTHVYNYTVRAVIPLNCTSLTSNLFNLLYLFV